jgi:hypothetical protein
MYVSGLFTQFDMLLALRHVDLQQGEHLLRVREALPVSYFRLVSLHLRFDNHLYLQK